MSEAPPRNGSHQPAKPEGHPFPAPALPVSCCSLGSCARSCTSSEPQPCRDVPHGPVWLRRAQRSRRMEGPCLGSYASWAPKCLQLYPVLLQSIALSHEQPGKGSLRSP